MRETIPSAFLSYTHRDDQQEEGKLRQLAKLLQGEVEVRLGQRFDLFVDKEKLGWGEPWKKRIVESLSSSLFLIPILTPWYFNSPACREEFGLFRRREERLNRDDLILPLYYIDCPLIDDPSKADKDEIARLIVSRQFVDWRTFRHSRLGDLRPEVDKMAIQLLAAINRRNEIDELGGIRDVSHTGHQASSPITVNERTPSMEQEYPRSIVPEAHGFSSIDGHEALALVETPISAGPTESDFAIGVQLYTQHRYKTALDFFRRAASGGDGAAMYNLGTMLERGIGGSADLMEAKSWYEKAADSGVTEALNSLGTLYEYGRGVPLNKDQARLWYERGAAAGNSAAASNLRRLSPRARNI